ncbi:MAG: ABC transporter permease [Caulobacteraceae bacterium]|nr:ABC transporter permease [Caulobacteraceae bacterium]
MRHFRIIGALLMREMTTRFGREGLGFLWVVGEPLLFCLGVLVMWTLIKPEYEHGVRLGPLVMTGYMSLLVFRHMISFSAGALSANAGLLYHRKIGIMHIFLARNLMEFAGGTLAFVIVYIILLALGQVGLPKDWLLLYSGWFLVGWTGFGIAMIFAGLILRYEVMERIVPLLGYVMIPLSGAFFMVSWLPAQYREPFLWVPFPNAIEMVRAGVFGEFVDTYYHADYALLSGAAMTFLGLVLLAGAKNRILIE